jgi:SAM-dependent methyltransferase
MLEEMAEKGFTRAARSYANARPDYAPKAIDFLLKEANLCPNEIALDLAAGSGHLTKHLLRMKAKVLASEPLEAMRNEFKLHFPQVQILSSAAENLDLKSSSIDAVFVGNAFHWFDSRRATHEIHRVLKPYGKLFVCWNIPDEGFDMIRKFTALLEDYKPNRSLHAWRKPFEASHAFSPLEVRRFEHDQYFGLEAFLSFVSSFSFVASLDDEERKILIANLSRFFDDFSDSLRGERLLRFPMRSDIEWAQPFLVDLKNS